MVGGRPPCTQTVDNVLIDMNISKTDLLALEDSLCDPFGHQSPVALAQVQGGLCLRL